MRSGSIGSPLPSKHDGMQQVLYRIPLKIAGWPPDGIPLYGFGAMLCVALILCTWLAGRRAQQEGIRKEHIQDLAIWLFVGGILGARFTFLYTQGGSFWDFYRIWDGGLVFYGSAIGGLVGYFFAYRFTIRKQGLSTWKLADVIAPCVALGLCIGRIGCLLNGCCYGSIACPDYYPVHYPLSSFPYYELVAKGYQTAAGFTMSEANPDEDRTVGSVDPTSPAAASGLRAGDIIVGADGKPIRNYRELVDHLVPPKEKDLALLVFRDGKEVELPSFRPKSLGLHPTQIYESISMALVFLLLMAYWPYRKRPGELMAVLMFCYGLQRYLVEMLRADSRPIGFEKYTSLLLVAAGLGLWLVLRFTPMPQQQRSLKPTT